MIYSQSLFVSYSIISFIFVHCLSPEWDLIWLLALFAFWQNLFVLVAWSTVGLCLAVGGMGALLFKIILRVLKWRKLCSMCVFPITHCRHRWHVCVASMSGTNYNRPQDLCRGARSFCPRCEDVLSCWATSRGTTRPLLSLLWGFSYIIWLVAQILSPSS